MKHYTCCDCCCDIEIDEKISPLFREIWKAEINVYDSDGHEHNDNEAMLEFITAADAEQFLNLVGREFGEAPGSFYKRVRAWRFETFVYDWPVDNDEWLAAPCSLTFSIRMYCPMSDVPELILRLKKYNQPKQCTECEERKPKSKFYGDWTMDDGLDVFCMECRQEFFENQRAYE